MKTRKVMDILMPYNHYICIRDLEKVTDAYSLYRVWYDMGEHRKLICKSDDAKMVLFEIMKRN